jgi:metallo-beta-lactamase class B
MKLTIGWLLAAALLAPQGHDAPLHPDPPIRCDDCEAWNGPKEPRRVFGNTYDVGVAGLGAVLIASPAGHILLDGGLPQSAPRIDESIRTLGFRTSDIKLIVNSHAHFDHAGGISALQRATGATVAASASGAKALQQGEPGPDDPQYGLVPAMKLFPKVARVRAVEDGEVLRVGDLAITAHLTPGHTPGSTTWSWRSCEGSRCADIVYADSLNAVSADGFRFSGDASHPSRVEAFRRSIDRVAALPCDYLLAVHPSFADGKTCRTYAEDARSRLEQRIRNERPDSRPASPGARRERRSGFAAR